MVDNGYYPWPGMCQVQVSSLPSGATKTVDPDATCLLSKKNYNQSSLSQPEPGPLSQMLDMNHGSKMVKTLGQCNRIGIW